MPFGIQPWHLVVVAIVALVIFGPARLPQLGPSIGSFFRDLRAGARDMGNGFKEGVQEVDDAKADAAGNFCIHCGGPNPSHALFCNACGKKIRD